MSFRTFNNQFQSPFWDFFDNINEEVSQFNRLLNDTGFRNNRVRVTPKSITDSGEGSQDQQPSNEEQKEQQAVAKRNPFVSLSSFNSPFLSSDDFNITPPVDVIDNKDNYELHVSVPGAKKEDVKVDFNPDTNEFSVSGEIRKHREDAKLKVSERSTGSFSRVIRLPTGVKLDEEKIKANYANGVLTLAIPKVNAEKGVNTKRIEISSNESWTNSTTAEEEKKEDTKEEEKKEDA